MAPRHAKTVADPPPGGSDFDRFRPPRPKGRGATRTRCSGRGPGAPGIPAALGDVPFPQLALVSPAARTAATAEIVLGRLADPPEVLLVDDLYGAGSRRVLALLRGLPDEVGAAMVVGHNPTVHALGLGVLVPGDEAGRSLTARRGFPTCALGVYRFESAAWSDVRAEGATLVALL